jgi:hypothetical protein
VSIRPQEFSRERHRDAKLILMASEADTPEPRCRACRHDGRQLPQRNLD